MFEQGHRKDRLEGVGNDDNNKNKNNNENENGTLMTHTKNENK